MKPLSLSVEDWPRFSALLDACLERPVDARAPWIDALRGADARFGARLHEVAIGAHPWASGDWLERPAGSGDAGDELAFEAGQHVGPWRLERSLGRGGMGEVWLAARADGAYVRSVALKLPHAFLLAGAQRERFGRERDILAGLAHPRIARLYDAGVAGDQPWLALEYVDGLPITAHAGAHVLSLRDRIGLLRQVADALQAAHARLVVHRDLKPANVLVTTAGEVKLLDFGIAKLLDAGDNTLTQAGGRAATPGYAAPEQLEGGAVTVATDVYALGVLAYELLAGRPPFERPSRLGRMLDGRGEPPLASTRATGASRRTLVGDLDAILSKALETDPARRYASAEAFSQDLANHLLHRPIAARRIGRGQRALRFMRRHRAATATTALVLLLLAAGIGGVLWQAQRAREEARRATAIKEFLLEVFTASDPRIASDQPRGTITARALLDAGARRVDARFASDPELRIELLRTLATLYAELGEDARYDALQARQLALVRARHGPLHPNLLDGAVEAAQRACARAAPADCIARVAEADRLLRASGDRDPLRRAQWWITRGLELQAQDGQVRPAGRAYREAVALYARHDPRSAGHVTALHELARYQQAMQLDYAGAIATYRKAQALAESLPVRNDAELQTLYGNLGLTYQQDGRFAEAAGAFRRSAEYADRTTGPAFPTAWVPRANAARTLHLAGARVEAQREFARLLPLLPADSRHAAEAASVRESYGERLSAEGRPEAGIPYLQAAADVYAAQPAFSFRKRLLQRFLGEAHMRAGHHALAGRLLKASLDDYLANQDPAGQPVMAIRESYGRWLLDDRRPDAARAQFADVVAHADGQPYAHVALAHGGLARVALAHGALDLALREIRSAQAAWAGVEGFRDVRMGPYLHRIHADVLAAQGDVAGAQRVEDAAARDSARYDAPGSATRVRRDMPRRAAARQVPLPLARPAKPAVPR